MTFRGDPRRGVRLLALEIAHIDRVQTEDTVLAALKAGRGGRIVTANLDILRQCVHDDDLAAMVRAADLVVADGAPLVWASRILHKPLPERVAGSDLIWTLSARAAQAGRSIYLLGGSPGAAEAAAERLVEADPALRVAGLDCPPLGFERDPERVAAVVGRVAAARPDIVYVGLGFPKQEHIIAELASTDLATWYMGVGVSIDFVAGHVRRAPRWTHVLGLEWAYRLYREPRKLFSRYVIHGVPFAARLLAWALVTRARA